MSGVASSYALLAAATCATLVSVPLALHYLSKERFGLWALMSSVGGYLSLIDLGMSGSVARLLIDHKDERKGGAYGSLVQTGTLVLVAQGVLLFAACWVMAPWLSVALAIPGGLEGEFIGLMRWQGVWLAQSFCLRIFSHVLFAHQRQDVSNYAQIASVGLSLALLWVFFRAGGGVLSLVWAALPSQLCGAAAMALCCWRLGLFPAARCWGRPSWGSFVELFTYGKDLFLVALGGQLILASQTVIITRRLGLDVAAAWSVGTRAFNLVSQLIWKIYDAAAPGFAEMVTQGEKRLALDRYRTVFVMSVSFAAFCAVGYALCNSLFVSVWTAGKNRIMWPPINDVLLGIWMIVSAAVHCHNCFVSLTKKIGFMRFVFFVEGSVFVVAALIVAGIGQLPGIILCSIVCSLVFSCAYGTWRVMRMFDLGFREVAWRWLVPMWAFLLRFAPVAAVTWYLAHGLAILPRLAIHCLLCGTAGAYLLAKYGIPPAFQTELVNRMPKPAGRMLARVFGSPGPSKDLASGGV